MALRLFALQLPVPVPALRGPAVRDAIPKRGDIVVFRPPGQEDVDFVKRVIGLPGDTIAVSGGRLILNGRPSRASRRG